MQKYKITKDRPLSWSAISSFEYSPEQWYKRYVLNEQEPPTIEMKFGKEMGERFASDPTFIPDLPRRSQFEYKVEGEMFGIPLIGYIDSYEPHTHLEEYKTGKKTWDQKRADTHGQIDMYLSLLYLMHGVRPEQVECTIHWLPTAYDTKFAYGFVSENTIRSFTTKRTMAQLARFGKRIKNTYAEMQEYADIHIRH